MSELELPTSLSMVLFTNPFTSFGGVQTIPFVLKPLEGLLEGY